MVNSADPDQLASSEANWSGSILFAKIGYVVFSKRRVVYLLLKCCVISCQCDDVIVMKTCVITRHLVIQIYYLLYHFYHYNSCTYGEHLNRNVKKRTFWRMRSTNSNQPAHPRSPIRSFRCPHEETLYPWLFKIHRVKILIRVCKCVGWFESSLGAHGRRYVFWCCGSFVK